MERSYKFRIYPTREQENLIQRTFGCCRFVYNYYLAQRMKQYKETGISPTTFQQSKDMTQLKRKLEWLREPDKSALQNSLKDLDTAYQYFYHSVKRGKHYGYPKFKSKRSNRRSYRSSINNGNIYIIGNNVKLPKLGFVKCAVSKEIKGRILSATVLQSPSGKYFVSICCTDIDFELLPKTGAEVGIDLGIKDLAITSDGTKYPNSKYAYKAEKKLARLQRQLSRKSKGSHNREKARTKVARLQEHIANQRRDSMQKLTTELIRKYDVICIEDLNPNGMVRNHKIAKYVADASFGEFRRELEYKAAWYGKTISVVDRFYPSSQICSNCGERWSGAKDLSVREWVCPVCGYQHDRDHNAAINILTEGMKQLA